MILPSHIVCAYCDTTRAVNPSGKVRSHRCPMTTRRCRGSGTPQAGHALAPNAVERDTRPAAIAAQEAP